MYHIVGAYKRLYYVFFFFGVGCFRSVLLGLEDCLGGRQIMIGQRIVQHNTHILLSIACTHMQYV